MLKPNKKNILDFKPLKKNPLLSLRSKGEKENCLKYLKGLSSKDDLKSA